MRQLARFALLLRVTRAHQLLRRYFVVNGFDGALTLLGIVVGFRLQGDVQLEVALSACVGAAVALAMSGLTSAYISEAAEKRRELAELEAAMVAELGDSVYGEAARVTPFLVAAVNGLAPLSMATLIMSPLWLASAGVALPLDPYDTAIAVAFLAVFLLGVFIGRVGGQPWLWTGLRATAIAAVTVGLVVLLG